MSLWNKTVTIENPEAATKGQPAEPVVMLAQRSTRAMTAEVRKLVLQLASVPMSYCEIAKRTRQPYDRIRRIGEGVTTESRAKTIRSLLPAVRALHAEVLGEKESGQ